MSGVKKHKSIRPTIRPGRTLTKKLDPDKNQEMVPQQLGILKRSFSLVLKLQSTTKPAKHLIGNLQESPKPAGKYFDLRSTHQTRSSFSNS